MSEGLLVFWSQASPAEKFAISLSKINEARPIETGSGRDFEIRYSPGKQMVLRAPRPKDCDDWLAHLAPHATGLPPASTSIHSPAGLPGGWRAAKSAKGKVFYYNKGTGAFLP